jgi:uncharacterized membrane protein YkoI
MFRSGILALAALLVCAACIGARAADQSRCFSPKERRAMIASKQAVPLARALRAARRRGRGEVLRARLCRGTQGLVYHLTMLSRNGKVKRATVNAVTGHLIEKR